MNQLEDDLHRVLQLARAHSRLSHQSKATTAPRNQSHQRSTVQRHRHSNNSSDRRTRPPATLLDAKLQSISAIDRLKRTIPKLNDCSMRTMRAQSEALAPASSSTVSRSQSTTALKELKSGQENESALLASRRDLYKRHFSGLQAVHAPSGLPKLTSLLDAAQHAKTRMARHSALAVGAAVLTSGDRIYAASAVENVHDTTFAICAERAALLKVLGEDPGEVIVAMAVCTDAEDVVPSPCGSCREFMAEAGDFPVYLVNARFETDETRSFDLFPRARQTSTAKVLQRQRGSEFRGECTQAASSDTIRQSISTDDDFVRVCEGRQLNVRDWTSEHVLHWLKEDVELPQYQDIFRRSTVDGCTLLHLGDCDLQLLLGVLQPLHRRRILLHIDRLKDRELLEHGIDYGQLQDYLAVLDRDRLTVVAELKATFDRLDQNKDGWLDFREVRQALSTLHCDAMPQVVDALLSGQLLGGDTDGKVGFPDFVAAFSSLAMQPAREGGGGSRLPIEADPAWQLPILDLRGLRRTFDKADKNKSDGIDEQELADLFHGLDASTSADACARKAREWFAVADSDGDGRLSFAEFLIRYIELKQVDVSKLKAFFESCEPVASANFKPVVVLRRALQSFFAAVLPAEISVWYKHHLNSELLRTAKDDVVSPADGSSAVLQGDGQLEQQVVVASPVAARTSLSISFADFVLAVFLFQDHAQERQQKARGLRDTLSNDALAHRSRIVHLQQTGHVRMCPQSKDAVGATDSTNLSLAEIRRNQLRLRLRSLQSQHQRTSGDEGKAASDDDEGDDSAEADARRQKRRLNDLLARMDATFDRFARVKAEKRNTGGTSRSAHLTRERAKKRSSAHDSDDDEKKRDTSDSEESDAEAATPLDCALNAMETAQAMTELGLACPREQMLRFLKDAGVGIHDRVRRRDFQRLFLHFHTQSESMLGKLPAHARLTLNGRRAWDDDAEHAKRMEKMAALLSGKHGKYHSRQDYDYYLLQRRQHSGSTEDADKRSVRGVSHDRKCWTTEMTRLQSERATQKQRTRPVSSKKRATRRRRGVKKNEAKAGDSSHSDTSSDSDRRPQYRGRKEGRDISRSRSRQASRSRSSTRVAHRSRSGRRRRHASRSRSSGSSSFSSNETTESEREELVRTQRRLEDAERRRKGFEIGDRVVAADDGRGTLIRLHLDYFVADVHFDSGKKAKNVDLSKLKRVNPVDEQAALRRQLQRGTSFHVGMRVAVSYRGTKTTRKGRISACRLDGTFDVFVDQLGERETLKRIPAKHLRALASKPAVYTVGANVTVKQKHAYVRGKVQLCRVDGTYDVSLRQDQSVLKRVEVDLLFPDDEDVDDADSDDASSDRAGESNHRAPSKKSSSTKKHAASDSEDEKKRDDDGYDDFELEFSKGDRVEARFQGNAAFYPGKISRVQTDGTYDVVYDDGDSELRVKSQFIRQLKSSSSSTSQPKTVRNAKDDDYDDDFE